MAGKRKVNKNKYVIHLAGISVQEVINTHFGNATTTLVFNNTDVETNLDFDDNVETTNLVKLDIVEDSKNFELSDILHENDKIGRRATYFLDSKKNRVKLWPVMIDTMQNGVLPLYTTKPCRNCHHGYNTHPIGCPIKYNSNLVDKDDGKYQQIVTFLREHNFSSDTNDFFETEHMFCSVPCVKSYIFSCMSKNPHSHKYKNALSYLTLMYKKVWGVKGVPPVIPSAGPIDTLSAYGGHLPIDEYRASFGVLHYEETVNIRRPYMFPCSTYVEEFRIKS